MHDLTRPEGSEPQDFHLSRRSLASMFFVGYALAAVSAEAAPVVTPTDGLTIDEVLIPNGAARPLPAYVARPAGQGRHPVVVVASEIFGIHDYIKDVCRRLAKAGYVAVAPDFFYRSGVNLPALTDMAEIRKVVGEASDAQVDGDVRATTDWVAKQPFAKAGAIGITGFCWGGAVVWRTAMVNPSVKAGVAWYGRLGAIVPRAGALQAPVLGLYGGQDKGIPLTEVDAMRAALKAAGKLSDIIVYPDAGHGFHADYRASYDPTAAADGWRRMLAHLKAHGVA
jgi:carboxymethylenebutenolidase